MLNKVLLMGRLVRDPEMRTTQSGAAVTSITLAVDRDYQSDDGSRETDFIDCVAWKNTASFIEKYFSKGQMMALSGRLQSRNWKDKEGNKRTSWEVIIDSAYFCGDKKSDGAANYERPAKKAVNVSAFEDLDDDDVGESGLPF